MNLFNLTNRIHLKFIKKIFIVTILCLDIVVAFGQDAGGDPFQYNVTDKMFLPTPEQASLMKFIDIPAGNHTGVHGFSVPIHTVQGKEFSLPINISYHGGGIKVDELSSSVGIGWALNIGGISLSEEVRGERDLGWIQRLPVFDVGNFDPVYEAPFIDYNIARRMTGTETQGPPGKPEVELQPDYYSYSLFNNQGRYMLDNENIGHTIPKDDIVIHTPSPSNQRITDNQGIDYYFSSYQQDYVAGPESTSFTPVIRYSYKIDKIDIPNDGSVFFEYYPVSYNYISSRSKTKKINAETMEEEYTGVSQVESKITEYLPKSITYKQTKINFKYKMSVNGFESRLDVNQGSGPVGSNKGAILEYIEVVDLSNNSAPIKNFRLITDYFNSGNQRIRLKAVEDLVQGTDYTFNYKAKADGNFLPPRFSYEQDYWGMYNGKGGSTSVPEVYIFTGTKHVRIPGADKNPDKDFAVIGSLESVKLPTGGTQVFEYELDEFRNVEFEDDVNSIAIHNYQDQELILAHYLFNFTDSEYQIKIIDIPSYTPDYRVGLNLKLHYETSHQVNSSSDGTPIGSYYKVSVHEKVTHHEILSPKYLSGDFEMPALDPSKSYYVKFYKVNNGSNPTYDVEVSIYLKWTHDYVTAPLNRNAGTLRVKSITLKDADGKKLIKKSYSYTDFDNNDKPETSSGFYTGTRPFPWYYTTSEPNGPSDNFNYYNIPDNAIQNLNSTFGKTVIYKKVTETYESTDSMDTSQNYKKEYVFSTPKDYYPNTGIPVIPPDHEEYQYGLLLEERWKNNQNQKVKVITNKYNLDNELDYFFNQFSANYLILNPNQQLSGLLSPSIVVANMGKYENHQNPNSIPYFVFGKNTSGISSAWIKLLESTTETYENGMMTMTQTQKYKYDDTNNRYKNIHPLETTTSNSKNEELKTEYIYGHPYKSSEPTTIKQYEDGNPVFIKKTSFQSGLPKYEFAKKPANALDDVLLSEDLMVTYDSYDTNSNLTQYTMANGIPVSIIWGYNGQYPIAKVEGATYTELLSIADPDNTSNKLINALQAKSDLDKDSCIGEEWNSPCVEAQLRFKLNQLRFNAFFNTKPSIITTYTYNPFFGVTSATQPNGQTEYYSYDAAGRLDEVYMMERDSSGMTVKRVLKKTKYNYQP